jgi:hypothetical protein
MATYYSDYALPELGHHAGTYATFLQTDRYRTQIYFMASLISFGILDLSRLPKLDDRSNVTVTTPHVTIGSN